MNNTPQNSSSGSSQEKRSPNIFTVLIIILLLTFVFNFFVSRFSRRKQVETSYTQFLSLVEADSVEYVQISDSEIAYMLTPGADTEAISEILLKGSGTALRGPSAQLYNRVYVTGVMDDPALADTLQAHDVEFSKTIVRGPSTFQVILSWILPFLIFYLIYYFFMRSMRKRMGGAQGGAGGTLSVGKSKAKEYEVEKDTGITFDDVAGQEEAKDSLREMIDFLHNPEKYKKIGAKQPKGALLVGPPGTGKTLLARAVAGEAKVPFYHLSGSEFIEMFAGVGASRVRDLFETANKNAPAIIFIDEIDAIGKTRDNQITSNDEREQTLNQLLAEMDGFDSSQGIIVLAATNRPEVLDKALLRPGRFDRQIPVELPDLPGREAILQVHADRVKLGPDVDLHQIALATNGASGADLANMINEGTLRAVKNGRHSVIQEDLMESVEVVIAGQKKRDRVMNIKERNIVAYHEVGHALVTALQQNSQPVHKITIVPRTKGALGYTMSVAEEERYLLTKQELLAEIGTLMGGRAAEIVEFGTITTGSSNDIERATQLARAMVTQYGMSDTFGPMGIESVQNQYLDGNTTSNVSSQTAALVDKEVQAILEQSQKDAIALLEDNRKALTVISEYLLEKETITGEEFMNLLEQCQTPDSTAQEALTSSEPTPENVNPLALEEVSTL